jgi:hypothetical protein
VLYTFKGKAQEGQMPSWKMGEMNGYVKKSNELGKV